MTGIQERVLILLKEIDAICQQNSIEYYLAAGSALGAVRHRGFLPWDDDADIYMTAKNFAKFYALRDQFRKDRALITMENDYSCGYLINRYADLTTTRLYRYLTASPQDAGLIVDILVLDPVPNDEDCIRNYKIAMTEFGNLLTSAAIHSTRIQYDLKDRENWKESRKIGRIKTLDKLKKRCLQYADTEGGVLIQRDPIVPHVWPEQIFGQPQYIPFEDTELPVPEHSYEHLCIAFDEDWMYVPKVENREQHWSGVILDISNNNPMNDYLSDDMARKTIHNYEKYHTYGNFYAPLLKKQNWERLKLVASKVRLHYAKEDISLQEVKLWLEHGDHDSLTLYFREYEETQTHRLLIGSVAVRDWLRTQDPFYIQIDDEFLYLFLRYLLTKPKLGKACRIMKARKSIGPLDENLKQLDELLCGIKLASAAIDDGDVKGAMERIRPLRVKYPENLYASHIYYAARFYQCSLSEKKELLQELSQLNSPIGTSDVILAILASCYMDTGNAKQAEEIHKRIAEMSNHGLILDHICQVYPSDSEIYQRAKERLGART